MTETESKPRLQGKLEWSDGKSIHIQAKFDKVALPDNNLTFISLVAFTQHVKAIRAGLAAGLDAPMRISNVTLTDGEESIVPTTVRPSTSGYRIDSHPTRVWLGSCHVRMPSPGPVDQRQR
jgi:hypothetical protein